MTREEVKNKARKISYRQDTKESLFFQQKYVDLINEAFSDFEKQQLENLAHLQMANDLIEKLKKEQQDYMNHMIMATDRNGFLKNEIIELKKQLQSAKQVFKDAK